MNTIHLIVLLCCSYFITCPPVINKKKPPEPNSTEPVQPEMNLEYERYLKEIIQALESDEGFRKKLETAQPDDIKNGKIADELEMVGHHIRTQLDEIKRQEMNRLKDLYKQQAELQGDKGVNLRLPTHLNVRNPHTFEIDDLKKLIFQTTSDLEEADRKRRAEFKEYEMEKEHNRAEKLKAMDEEHKQQAKRQWEAEQQKHKEHPKLHHPGSKDQLEEVWEEQDQMKPEDFEPKTFFYMHDLNGDGFWDNEEVNALFQKELDKMYDPNAPEDDMKERYEEMERMREHVFNETDVDKDRRISFDEFIQQSRRQEFEKDQGWEGLDEQKVYTDEEFQEFERTKLEAMSQGIPPQAVHMEGGIEPGPPHQQVQDPMDNSINHHPQQISQHPMGQQKPQPMGERQQSQHPIVGQQVNQQPIGNEVKLETRHIANNGNPESNQV